MTVAQDVGTEADSAYTHTFFYVVLCDVENMLVFITHLIHSIQSTILIYHRGAQIVN